MMTECVPITKGQGCGDWFIIRRFSLAATTWAPVLKTNRSFRAQLGLGP